MDEEKITATEEQEEKQLNEDTVHYGLNDDEYYALIKSNIEKRRESVSGSRKKAHNRLTVFVLVTVAVIGLFIFSASGYFTTQSIEVEGASYFTEEEVLSMAHASPGKNLIYKTDSKKIKDYLNANPYISSVRIRRQLPSTLVITIVERRQIAALVYDDDYLIIDEDAVLLRKTRTTPKITVVRGVKINRIEPGEKIGAENENLLEDSLALLRNMRDNDLYFTELDMRNTTYIRAHILDNLVCIADYEVLTDAIINGKLHAVIKKLFKQDIERGTITFDDDGYASFVPSL